MTYINRIDRRRAEIVISRRADMIYRLAFSLVKNRHDAMDVFQGVALKYIAASPIFNGDEHEKAWFIRTTVNTCKSFWRALRRSGHISYEGYVEENGEFGEVGEVDKGDIETLDAIFSLPHKLRTTIYLHYYEGYSVREMAEILRASESAIKSRLARGRKKLAVLLGDSEEL